MIEKVFDIAYLRDHSGLDIDTIKELKDIYIMGLEENSIELNQLISEQTPDYDMIYPIAHSVKGTAVSVGDMDLSKMAEDACNAIKGPASLAELYDKLHALDKMMTERLTILAGLDIS